MKHLAGLSLSGPEVLDKESYSHSKWERMVVASNPQTSPATLTRLASDPSRGVRSYVEENPSTPPLVKLWLTSDYSKSMSLQEFVEAAK